MTPATFLATHALFTRDEFAAAVASRGLCPATISAHLARWRRQGRIQAVKRGVYARSPDAQAGAGALPDLLALASRMAPDAALAYHTALEALGVAPATHERLTFVTWTKAKPVEFRSRHFVPVRPRAPLAGLKDLGERWIERIDRAGVECRVTSLERTVVDIMDRPDLAGGIHEVWRSVASVPALDPDAIEEYVFILRRRALVARLGFLLESRRDELAIPAATLDRLATLRPGSPMYLDRKRPGRMVARWNLIVPLALLE